ncbi:TOG array regulator of axonemal microtubules protein 1-like isoform X2 [Kryptolebias marmoratus]|uniref:TOG array regulator of axonemal microtubules protein 1-like isoform X2 n=1 Tax=Kryptolebias marmoratus TaxID=37003 RepID=UPI000D530847|nr:TOG array regulator of axonemal microtubules protein 1-like isoform X2 [Kryptolebias marmoratus]XP_024864224.1 TOG array regulator of axonemal microtubules protein 1-like isoform X2 [Kryptolebias marmoratus]XP_024866050.1 TOG array regulator of axonemal microtubules protein 1-like isoform X2 [Kryptolebias marmoratus]
MKLQSVMNILISMLTEKEAVSLQKAEPQGEPVKKGPRLFRRNSVAPLPRPAAAPKKTRPAPAPKPDPPKTKRPARRAAVGSTKTTNMKKPALQTVKAQPKEELKPLPNPVQSLSLVFQHLSQDDWEKKVEGLELLRALAQHHPDTLMDKLHEVCLALIEDIKNLRSSVACAAIDTLGSLYTHLQKDMDVQVERTGRALLLRVAQASANIFVQQQANLALEAMVKNCSPARMLTALLNTGLSHLSAAVRASTAQQLHLLADEMGVTAMLTAGQSFTSRFLLALSKMCLDAAAAVRPHGLAVLKQLSLHKDFMKLWQKAVEEKERFSVQKVLQKARRM